MKAIALTLPLVVGASLLVGLGGPAAGSALIIERITVDADTIFSDRCNQGTSPTDCEKAVAEGRAGNGGPSGDWEVGLGVPNTLTTANLNAGGGTAQFTGWGAPTRFSLSYDAATQGLSFAVGSLTALATTVDLGAMTGVFVRARGRNDAETASLSDLEFNGHLLDDGTLLSTSTAQYLAFAGFDPTASWTLSGIATLIGGRGSAPSFQIKLTDAQVVPIPAAVPLLASGVGALAWLRHRRRVA